MERSKATNIRLASAQQDAETFLFHGRMEAADHTVPGVTPLGGLIVGREDDFAGATGGTEERGFGQGE